MAELCTCCGHELDTATVRYYQRARVCSHCYRELSNPRPNRASTDSVSVAGAAVLIIAIILLGMFLSRLGA